MGIVSKIAPAVLGAMMTVAVAAATGEESVAPAPSLTVEQQTIDLGDVTAGQDAVAVFRFHNSGATDVRIVRAKPS
jgi:hypothetical protein